MTTRDTFLDVHARMGRVADLVMAATGCSTDDAERIGTAVVAEDPLSRAGIHPGYSEALDRVFDLRVAAVHEARTIEAHLALQGYPKAARPEAQQLVDDLRSAVSQFNGGHLPAREPELSFHPTAELAEKRAAALASTLVKEGVDEQLVPGLVASLTAADPDDQLEHYVAARQEEEALGIVLARGAEVLSRHLLYKTFPKSRRGIAEEQALRMSRAWRREAFAEDYADLNRWRGKDMLRAVGAQELLTRSMWEENRAVPKA